MKIFIPLFLSVFFILSSSNVYAGAAEKWEYDVIPDQSQTLQIKGHKVDQYGAAVNDYDYNTKIDPKTSSNKFKMGTVGMGRLLKVSGWGLLGSAALEALLEAVDWVIDPATQSIWRNKRNNSPEYSTCFDGKYLFTAQNNFPEICPDIAIEKFWKSASSSSMEYKFKEWQVTPSDVVNNIKPGPIFYTITGKTSSGTVNYPNQKLEYKLNPNYKPDPVDKEVLTPEALADYANHTHPDYSNPELAPKLAPKYSPEIQTDLWKPSNPWEDTNSPTVQEVKKELEKAPPEPKEDPELTPNPDTGGLKLPSFCSWAAPVCDFIKWLKQDPEIESKIDLPEKEIEQQDIKKDRITVNARSCPADIRFDVQGLPFGIQINKAYQMQPICNTLEPLKYVFQLITFCLCAFMLLRI